MHRTCKGLHLELTEVDTCPNPNPEAVSNWQPLVNEILVFSEVILPGKLFQDKSACPAVNGEQKMNLMATLEVPCLIM